MTTVNKSYAAKDLEIKVEALKIAFGVLILFAGGQLSIPLEPVPITLQTVGVMLVGLIYNKRSALISVVLFVALGGMGLPLFQDFAGGFDILYGPTAGYIFGFIACVYLMSYMREKFNLESFWGILLNCTLGTVVIFIFGVSWLAYIVGFNNAITYGVLPFILPGALKALMLTGALRIIKGPAKHS